MKLHQINHISFKLNQKLIKNGIKQEFLIQDSQKVSFYSRQRFIIFTNISLLITVIIDYKATQPYNENSYDYYIHYEDLDRRHDQWVSYIRIRKTNENIDEVISEQVENLRSVHPNDNPHLGMNHTELLAHQQYTKLKTIPRIQIGNNKSQTWYYSPYPIYYYNIECLYICDFCLSFYTLKSELKRHSLKCPLFHPPGDEIYRDLENMVAVFQIDGSKNPVYCQNLAFLSKLFLDHKNLHYDMSIFLFYILCQIHNNEYHIAGYFSKEKQTDNNLSCILVLPFYQRKGYGKFLITFSYELSLLQLKIGGPQKPLSDMGKKAYLSWWAQKIIDFLRQNLNSTFNLEEISKKTSINQEDIKWTMDKIKIIKFHNGYPIICTDEKYLSEIYKQMGQPGLKVFTQKLHWVPFKVKWENPTSFL